MKFRRILTASTAMVALSGLAAGQAAAATATTNASASVANAAAITGTQALNFGTLSYDGNAGTATISPGGVVTPSGGFVGASGTPQAGAFNISGSSGVVDITVAIANLSDGGTGTLTVSTVKVTGSASFSNGAGATASVVGADLGTGGTATTGSFNIGTTVTAAASQPTGSYTGQITITVNNN